MAEIKIEKKKPIWPWILLVLILIAIVAFFIYQNQADDDYMDDDNTDMVDDADNFMDTDTTIYDTTRYQNDGAASMTAVMEAMRDSTRFGTDSTFTKTALHNLAKLTVAKARLMRVETSSALSDLEAYTMRTDTVDTRADSSNMASIFRDVTQDIVTVIETIANKNGMTNGEEVKQFKETSSKLNTTTTLAKQQKTIQTFFRQAHDVLHNMNS